MEFTKNQERAINEHSGNILVSAAAGSGKTAVLVKRIETELLREKDPYDIDRILVMTFTKAAANEMKDRILAAINENISAGNSNRRLYKQAALISNAHISTIHGFCLDVIKNHFHVVGLSPDFRTMDEVEGKLLKNDTLEEVLEEAYEEGREAFYLMTEHIDTGRSDKGLSELIIKLHDFAVSNPDVNAWFDRCIKTYTDITEDNLSENPVIIDYINSLKSKIRELIEVSEKALEICNKPNGPYMYIPAITDDIESMTRMVNSTDFAGFFEASSNFKPMNLSTKKDKNREEVDEALKKEARGLRDNVKKRIADINKCLNESPKKSAELICACSSDVIELIEITRRFYNRYLEKKTQKNLIDFNDMEHYCLKILTESKTIADEYREYFREIYVDEYQDSNLVQEAIVNLIAKDNVFLVGDVKQSIYKFRMARPELFMNKYENYCKGEGGIAIDLSDNFRSRREVTDSVNEVFFEIMHKEFGGIEYDDSAKLNYGANYYDEAIEAGNTDILGTKLNNTPANLNGQNAYRTEFIGIVKDIEIDPKELEALTVANKITGLLDSKFMVYDKALKALRPIKYSDIVILLRTQTGWAETFCKAIESKGIPIHAPSSTGYFNAPEIVNLLEFLKVIDNPLQDIPLVAVMKSVLFDFTEEELAIIRSKSPKGSFYIAVCSYVDAHDTTGDTVSEKIEYFLRKLKYYKEKSTYISVYELLREIIDGDYGRIILASKGGEKRYMNLNMLLSKALEYEKTSYKGLFQFVRYIDYLKKNEIDYGEANINNENDNSVRLLTIHKSKGLEFPVVFLCGMHKAMNFMDSQAAVIPDADYGLGINLVDSKKRTKYKTLIKSAIAEKNHAEALSEEMRVLYVAMTRAREKLIMTGVVTEDQRELNKTVIISKAASFLDLLVYARGKNEKFKNIDFSITDVTKLIDEGVKETIYDSVIKKKLLDRVSSSQKITQFDEEVKDVGISEISERINFRYSFDEKDTFAKVSVTELKKRSMKVHDNDESGDEEKTILDEEETVIPLIPSFLSKEEKQVAPTLFGTAFHRMLEIWDYSLENTPENIQAFFERVRCEKKMEEDLLEIVRPSDIYDFLRSDIGMRMKKAANAGLLKREQPFVMYDISGMLVQGIIDAFFIEDDRIILVDYKTDVINSGEELIEKYHVQLEYYAKALEKLLKQPVKEKIIYSRRLRKSVIIP